MFLVNNFPEAGIGIYIYSSEKYLCFVYGFISVAQNIWPRAPFHHVNWREFFHHGHPPQISNHRDMDVVSQGVFFGFPKGIFFLNSLNDREVFSGSLGFPWTLSPPPKTP